MDKKIFKTKYKIKKSINEIPQGELKRLGFPEGRMTAQYMPKHIIWGPIEDKESGVRMWMYDVKRIPQIVVSYPYFTKQEDLRKKIAEAEYIFKFFCTYKPIWKKYTSTGKPIGKPIALEKVLYTPWGEHTGIKIYLKKIHGWIQERFKNYKDEGSTSKDAYIRTREDFNKEKPYAGEWKPRKRTASEPPLKRNPIDYNLSLSSIKRIALCKETKP